MLVLHDKAGTAHLLPGGRLKTHIGLRPVVIRASSANNKNILAAGLGKGFAIEASVESFQPEPGCVYEPKPLVLRGPPQRACPSTIQCYVYPILAHSVTDVMRDRFCLVNAVKTCSNLVIKRESIPGEPAGGLKCRGNPFEDSTTIGLGVQVQQCTKRTVDQRRWFIESEAPHVTLN